MIFPFGRWASPIGFWHFTNPSHAMKPAPSWEVHFLTWHKNVKWKQPYFSLRMTPNEFIMLVWMRWLAHAALWDRRCELNQIGAYLGGCCVWEGEGLLWSKDGSRIVITRASVSISRFLSIFCTLCFSTSFFKTHTLLLMNRHETTFSLSVPHRVRLFLCVCVVFLYTILPNTIRPGHFKPSMCLTC